MEKKELEVLIGLGTGFLIGSLLGILFAPYSGKGLRKKLTNIKDDIADRINKFKQPEKYSRIKP